MDATPALGAVVDNDRGSLPFALIHGEPLIACATWALDEAGVVATDLTVPWSAVVEAVGETGEAYVLHDPLCPMTPATFIAACVRTAVERDAVVVAVRPVTDTVKTVADGLVGDTLDRDALVEVASPIVLPASVTAGLETAPGGDFAELASALAARYPVISVVAPPEARRVTDPDDVRVLEALTAR